MGRVKESEAITGITSVKIGWLVDGRLRRGSEYDFGFGETARIRICDPYRDGFLKCCLVGVGIW